MIDHVKAAVLATLLVPGAAFADIKIGDQLGASETAIRAALESQGYTPSEIEFEDGKIEVEAMRAGQEFEFDVSTDTGLVFAVYQDDDEDDDDSDDADDD